MRVERIHFKQLDSTNTKARELAFNCAPDGTLVTTDIQTSGRGRMGRSWDAGEGKDVIMSMILRPELEPENIAMITIIAAMAVCRAINEVSGLKTKIKWPNDIVCDGRKLCGILTEGIFGDEPVVILGIGINVGARHFSRELADKAASIDSLTGNETGRDELIDRVWEVFDEYYQVLQRDGSLENLAEEYNANTISINSYVERTNYNNHEELKGTARGIDGRGYLVIELADGELVHLGSGEIAQNLAP